MPLRIGCSMAEQNGSGAGAVQDGTEHVNVLQLRAVHLTINHFLPYLRGNHVLVWLHNTLAVFHINHQGGTKLVRLVWASQDLLTGTKCQKVLSKCTFSGERNQVADFLSST